MTNLYVNYRKRKIKIRTNNYHKNNKMDFKNKNSIGNEKEKTKNNLKPSSESTKEIKHKKGKNNNLDKLKKIEMKEKVNISSLMDISKRTLNNVNKEPKNIENKKESKKGNNSIITLNSVNYLNKFNKDGDNFTEKDMKKYLSTSPDEMDFHNALIKD